MERELWPLLYRELRACANDFRQKYVHIQPWALVACLLWAALHDRPASWACKPRNWSTTRLRPRRLPSPSTLSRRGYGVAAGLLWRALEQRLRGRGEPALAAFLDGKPSPVGGCTKDRDAAYGRAAGVMGKGYKLHAVWAGRPMPEAWDVTSLKVGETTAAAGLFGQLAGGGGYVLADGNYDSSPLFDRAAEAGYQLVVPVPSDNAGKGHHYQSPHRLRCIDLMRPDPWTSPFGRQLYALRTAIERGFGNATSFGGGLGPLPAWARRRRRVRFWVWAKLLINAARIIRNQRKQRLTPSLQ